MYNNILDVKGLKVGQVEDRNGLTGCTAVSYTHLWFLKKC